MIGMDGERESGKSVVSVQLDDEKLFILDWLVWFYGISAIVGYLMPNPLYSYILNIYDLVWLGFMAYQPL